MLFFDLFNSVRLFALIAFLLVWECDLNKFWNVSIMLFFCEIFVLFCLDESVWDEIQDESETP